MSGLISGSLVRINQLLIEVIAEQWFSEVKRRPMPGLTVCSVRLAGGHCSSLVSQWEARPGLSTVAAQCSHQEASYELPAAP